MASPFEDKNDVPSHWGMVGTILWGALVTTIFIFLQVLVAVVVVVKTHGRLSQEDFQRLLAQEAGSGTTISRSACLTTIVCGALLIGIIKLKRGAVLSEYLALRAVPLRSCLLWLGILAAFIAGSDSLTVLLNRPVVPDLFASAYSTAHPLWILWIALLLAAPLFEETFFRGFLFKGFEASFLRSGGAVVLTAALWSFLHIQYDAYGMTTVFLLGILFGAARVSTRSLWVPIILHSASNLVATIEAATLA